MPAARVCPCAAMQIQNNNYMGINNLYKSLTFFFSQVKNKPYRLGEKYAFVLESGAFTNSYNQVICMQALVTVAITIMMYVI
jgi:hypothetical protein